MQRPVALQERGRFAVLLTTMVHQARQHPAWREPDRRVLRIWRQFVLAVLVQRHTWLLKVARALLPLRRAHFDNELAIAIANSTRLTVNQAHYQRSCEKGCACDPTSTRFMSCRRIGCSLCSSSTDSQFDHPPRLCDSIHCIANYNSVPLPANSAM